jgi:hypothetical protein
MHIQAKAKIAASPPDLEKFVKALSEPETPPGEPDRLPINIEGVGGTELETGGDFIFSFDHDRVDDLRTYLRDAGYEEPEIRDAERGDFFLRVLDANEPGQLLAAIQAATLQNLSEGRLIKHVVIGQETQTDQRFYVQISFQEVKRG